MKSIHIGYLMGSTADLLSVRAVEENGICEFKFGEIKIIYFGYDKDVDCSWAAYYDGMTIMRTHRFANLAFFLNSVVRHRMQDAVLINCWIENY